MPGINVNQITSMLAKLADPALQQYAAMHKDNPYIVSLAVAESARRKELRAAGAGQAAMQPQPKVADAAIAEMALPEEQGIGALPAPNMQMMADGGIAGFDDQEPVQMMNRGGRTDMYDDGMSMFDKAMEAEGVRSPMERAFLQAIHAQESSSKATAKTSNRGAQGAMQILPKTFKSVADPGMDISNPLDNMRAGIRYARQGFKASQGDPVLAGAYYYGGPGGMRRLMQGDAVRDPKNPKAPNTQQYGESVARRMEQLLQRSKKPSRPSAPPEILLPPNAVSPMFAAAPANYAADLAMLGAADIPQHSEAPIMAAAGGVMRYQDRGLVKPTRSDLEEQTRRDRRALAEPFAALGDVMVGGPYNYLAQTGETVANTIGLPRLGRALGLYDPDVTEVKIPRIGRGGDTPYTDMLMQQAAAETPTTAPRSAPTYSPSDISGADRRLKTRPQTLGIPSISGSTAPVEEKADASGPLAPVNFAGLDLAGLFTKARDTAQSQKHPYMKDMEALAEERVSAARENLSGLEAINKQFEDIFKGQRQRLGTREAEVGKLKDEAIGLALLQAGAAMMQTPGKIGAALGRGFDVGSKQYAAGMEKFRAAQEKISDARDRLELLEAQRGEMSARELHKARNDIRATNISAREDMIKANMEMYKLNREDSGRLFTAMAQLGIAQLQEQGQTARAGMLPGELRGAMALGTGDTDKEKLESGLKRLQEVQSGKFNVTTSYADYLKAFAGKETLTPPLSFTQYAAQFGATLPR